MNVLEKLLRKWEVIKHKITQQHKQLGEKEKAIKDCQGALENSNELYVENMRLQTENMNLMKTMEGQKLNQESKIELRTKVRKLIEKLESNDEDKGYWKKDLERFINFI